MNSFLKLAQLTWDTCSRDAAGGGKIPTLKCLPIVFQNLISILIVFGGVVAVIMVTYGGIKFLLSGGEQEKVAGARRTITFALIGLAIIILSFVAIKVISTVTGVQCSVLGVSC